jgi:hypothetical protein
VDDEFEMLAVDPKYAWEIVGIYRTPNDDVRLIELLAARTGLGYSIKQSIIGGDLNLPQVECKGVTEGMSVNQAYTN